jgi:hypothetical protein
LNKYLHLHPLLLDLQSRALVSNERWKWSEKIGSYTKKNVFLQSIVE